jgi:anti-sigma regulatory factor (Ser/Thr protein kinase)
MNSQHSELARLEVRDTAGVFAARQLGRGLAAVLALEQQDQIRVATALSEVSRSAVTAGRTAVITGSPRRPGSWTRSTRTARSCG